MSTSPDKPAMMKASAELREAGRIVRELSARLREVAARHDELHAQLNLAWADHQAVAGDYHRLLRGVLLVLDDCAQAVRRRESGIAADLAIVHDGLRGVLAEEGVEPLPVAAGDRFDPERHESHGTATDPDTPPGTIAEVVTVGYQRRVGDAVVVIRPATVQVSASEESGESR